MFVFLFIASLLAAAFAAPVDPLIGGFRPVPPAVGGPIGVAPVDSSATNDRASLSVLEGGNNVKPWLSSQPKIQH